MLQWNSLKRGGEPHQLTLCRSGEPTWREVRKVHLHYLHAVGDVINYVTLKCPRQAGCHGETNSVGWQIPVEKSGRLTTVYLAHEHNMNKSDMNELCRLGRRPVKQGPRNPLGNRDGIDKLDIGTIQSTIQSSVQSPIQSSLQLPLQSPVQSPRPIATATKSLQLRNILRLGTWNVRSLWISGKLEVLEREMERLNINILGISELRWTGIGHFKSSNGHTLIYSGADRHERGVGFWIRKDTAEALLGYNCISDRIITIRLKGKPGNLTIFQIYAPTSAATPEERDDFYEELRSVLKSVPTQDTILLSGDFNAKIGKGDDSIGKFGLGETNEAGQELIDFCHENGFIVANAQIKMHPRHLYTWTSPDGKTRNQIDYFLIPQRWKTSMRSCRTYPSADCDSDHNLLMMKFAIKLQKLRTKCASRQYDFSVTNKEEFQLELHNQYVILAEVEEEERDTVEVKWSRIKKSLERAAAKTLSRRSRDKKQNWISEETIRLIEEKRLAKRNPIRYKQLQKQTRKLIKRDKEAFMATVCQEVEEANRKRNTKRIFHTVKRLNGKFKPKLNGINSKEGNWIADSAGILDRWREYCEELYQDDHHGKHVLNGPIEPPPMLEEVEEAIESLRDGKAPGPDGIAAEMLKLGGSTIAEGLLDLCNEVWCTGKWPKEWTRSLYVPIHKKGSIKECRNYRTISLISHASKVLLRIILRRIAQKTNSEIAEEQAGFREGRGTRDHICNLRIVMQEAEARGQPLYLCFVDFERAFDSVNHAKLWCVMLEMGFPVHLVQLISSLYDDQNAAVRLGCEVSEWFQTMKGVRQGCTLSPCLFNLFGEAVMRLVLDGFKGGFRIGGRLVNNFRYADDIVLLATSPTELQELIHKLEGACDSYGLKINTTKTKIMTFTRKEEDNKFFVYGEELEPVVDYKYLGCLISKDGRCERDIKLRLGIATTILTGLSNIWKSRQISIPTKLRLLKALVWSVATYGCEGWTLTKTLSAKIQAFGMKCYRRVLRIPWTAKMSNENVLQLIRDDKSCLSIVISQKLRYYGHSLRHNGLQSDIISGIVPGIRRRGRPRRRWLDDITEWTGLRTVEAYRKTQDRDEWRRVVHVAVNAVNGRHDTR